MEKMNDAGEVMNERKPTGLLARLKNKIMRLFEPEEVEVTFRRSGNRITYTYTKVNHKQVA